jgi:hypothetical protein
MPILNYTTTVDPGKTAIQIQSILARHGVRRILFEYSPGSRNPTGLSFTVETTFGDRPFTLPVHVDGVEAVLRKDRGKARLTPASARALREQAERVAWRILKDWIEAQLAIVEAGLVTIDEVMLPYLRLRGDKTLYEVMREQQLALPGPTK